MKPRADIRRRLVLIHSDVLGSWHLCKVGESGVINRRFQERVSFADTYSEALRSMGVTVKGFFAVTGMSGMKFRSHPEQVEITWAQAVEQKQRLTIESHE